MAGSGTLHLRSEALLSVEHLVVDYAGPRGRTVHAVADVSLDVVAGETVGLVGESGCGKSTTARAIAGHLRPTSGSIVIGGHDLATLDGIELRRSRAQLQMVFQDPISSLHPRRRVEDIVGEGLRMWRRGTAAERAAKVRDVMEAVGLTYDPGAKRRRSAFSGGQCQRMSIARALVMDPRLIVCDEPVSSLDVSVQAQILNLLADLRERFGLTLLFIAHDLAVVKHISDRIIVMYMGKICEVAPPGTLYSVPSHPYTRLLLDAIPSPTPGRRTATSLEPVDAVSAVGSAPPTGCRFRARCPRAAEVCATQEPVLRPLAAGHFVACHFPSIESNGAQR